jgi:hypothetical protein
LGYYGEVAQNGFVVNDEKRGDIRKKDGRTLFGKLSKKYRKRRSAAAVFQWRTGKTLQKVWAFLVHIYGIIVNKACIFGNNPLFFLGKLLILFAFCAIIWSDRT